MSYYFQTIFEGTVDEAYDRVAEALKAKGFGILTEIDVKTTFKNKLDVDFRPYRILGACNPNFAHQAISAEENIGVFLPCNVILQEKEAGKVQITAVDPIASMTAVSNPELITIATEVQHNLQQAIESL